MFFVDECDVYGGKLSTIDQTCSAVAEPRTDLNWFFWEFHRPAFNICPPYKVYSRITQEIELWID
jgi:hypothetical protein